jgi:hypothetical protein
MSADLNDMVVIADEELDAENSAAKEASSGHASRTYLPSEQMGLTSGAQLNRNVTRSSASSSQAGLQADDSESTEANDEQADRFAETSLTGLSGFDHPDKLMARRGWLFLSLCCGCLVLFAITIATHFKNANAPIKVVPSIAYTEGERQTKIERGELRNFAERVVTRQNTYSSWNADGVRKSILPFYSAEIAGAINDQFLADLKAQGSTGHRQVCFITGTIFGPVDTDTVYNVKVFYDIAEALERIDKKAESMRMIREMVDMDVIRVDKTEENPLGLQIIRNRAYGEDEYKRIFGDDAWTIIRTPKAAK